MEGPFTRGERGEDGGDGGDGVANRCLVVDAVTGRSARGLGWEDAGGDGTSWSVRINREKFQTKKISSILKMVNLILACSWVQKKVGTGAYFYIYVYLCSHYLLFDTHNV